MITQKTVRFYDSPRDSQALDAVNNYKEYGFSNAREFIIAAIINYSQKSDSHSSVDINLDELADKIIERLNNGSIQRTMIVSNEPIREERNAENYEKALSFIDSL